MPQVPRHLFQFGYGAVAVLLLGTSAIADSGFATGPGATANEMTFTHDSYPVAADVLSRIVEGFALPYRETRTVDQEFNWYVRHPDYLNRVFTRARPYLPHILESIEQRGLPMELALLPVVESAFDPFAYSHGQAAGLWQFIPATGRRFGLEQNWWYDGRRDVIESTRAALDYLERLHRIFDGDWLLAIAAYNSGEGNVRRAIRRAGGDATFWELRLPRETEIYVPRLLALSRLVSSPGDFGIVLPYVSSDPYFDIVETGSQIDLALAADLAEIDLDELYRLNPGHNRWASGPDGPHRLLVPVANAPLLRVRLEQLPEQARVRWNRYRIREGDTLSEIARAHNTTVTVLRDANNLRNSTIRAGRHLMIPTASLAAGDYRLSADSRLATKQKTNADTVSYTVREGDSFWEISRRYNVGVRELARWNGMAPRDTLSVGRKLVVHGAAADTTIDPPEAGMPSTQRRIRYTVRKGDSLARISSKFKVSVSQLQRWNQSVAKQKYLQPGQKLVMYIDIRKQSGG